jgi:hypothetical protein
MKYPEILDVSNVDEWKEKYLRKEFKSFEWDLMVNHPVPDVFEIAMFSEEFSDKFVENLQNLSFLQEKKWDTNINYLSLTNLGFDEFYTHLIRDYGYKIVQHFWHIHGQKWQNMNVSSAVVKMEPGQDLRLHHDFINITMVCQLYSNSEGGEFYFEKYEKKINLKQGHLYIFPGQITHRYGIRLVKNESKYFIKSYCNAS